MMTTPSQRFYRPLLLMSGLLMALVAVNLTFPQQASSTRSGTRRQLNAVSLDPRTVQQKAPNGVAATRLATHRNELAVPSELKKEPPLGPIPHTIWFTYKENILEQRKPLFMYKNVMKTIQTYKALHADFKVNFMTDKDCLEILGKVSEELRGYFEKEDRGMIKADICRSAALYLYGGYYFDVDMEVIQAIEMPSDVSFSTCRNMKENDPHFFQSWMAGTAYHPVFAQNIKLFLEWYRKPYDPPVCRGKHATLGTCILYNAFHQIPKSERGTSLILHETDGNVYPEQLRPQPDGFTNYLRWLCNVIVHDPVRGIPYFYSRTMGAEKCKTES